MDTFGIRLKQERQRLQMSQEDIATVGGVKRRAQISYEQEERVPDVAYMVALSHAGVDIDYVMLGTPSANTLSPDESELLIGYRKLDVRGKARVLGVIEGVAAPTQPAARMQNVVFQGKVGQQIAGDITAPQAINMGKKK
jgi:transcriptional regulator with XRE-family HTH domain